mmetsp:Transcript_44947/g.144003  ORF Transcript_44947/g.144003 Transcript_44947/m.144003 type:complete len:250 (+) Transcript_44947:690-1439(+)
MVALDGDGLPVSLPHNLNVLVAEELVDGLSDVQRVPERQLRDEFIQLRRNHVGRTSQVRGHVLDAIIIGQLVQLNQPIVLDGFSHRRMVMVCLLHQKGHDHRFVTVATPAFGDSGQDGRHSPKRSEALQGLPKERCTEYQLKHDQDGCLLPKNLQQRGNQLHKWFQQGSPPFLVGLALEGLPHLGHDAREVLGQDALQGVEVAPRHVRVQVPENADGAQQQLDAEPVEVRDARPHGAEDRQHTELMPSI